MTYFEKLQKILRLAGGQKQVASWPGFPLLEMTFLYFMVIITGMSFNFRSGLLDLKKMAIL